MRHAASCSVTWTYTSTAGQYIWGFKITIWGRDREGKTWAPLDNWNAVLLRVYTEISTQDAFDATAVTAEGLTACTSTGGTCVLTFGSITSLTAPDFTTNYQIDRVKFDVSTINLDFVESSIKTSGELAINP